jgi:hypothetical protein
MAAGLNAGQPAAAPRVYPRALAAAGAAAAAALAVHLVANPARPGTARGLAVCGALFLLSALLVVANFGDRVEVGEEGVRLRNAWREKIGIGRARLLRWEDVEEVRELPAPRPGAGQAATRAFVVRTHAGRRMVFDSIDGIEEIAEEFRRRLAPGQFFPP